ncbi:c-type cytochrome [Roseovarius spongiae]|nr:cytochrome c [Roseovarius spongiae]
MARSPHLCVSALFLIAISSLCASGAVGQETKTKSSASAGRQLFLSTGCGACHRIAGTDAQGEIGPDLTHLASRATIGANIMPMTSENLSKWIRHTQMVKPGARMPSFGMLPVAETDAIVDYLVTLK